VPRSWRIVKAKHAATAFDGEGARLAGGRWNSPGHRVVYTAESRSLAILEILVHLSSSDLLAHYVLLAAEFPATSIATLDSATLPPNWRASPAPTELQDLGNRWLQERRSVVLRVPSALVDGESVYLLNPRHPEFRATVTISRPGPDAFDAGLLKKPAP